MSAEILSQKQYKMHFEILQCYEIPFESLNLCICRGVISLDLYPQHDVIPIVPLRTKTAKI